MQGDDSFRARLGERLVVWSTFAIMVLVVAIMFPLVVDGVQSGHNMTAVSQMGDKLLTSLLPLFGTWVGTVLTFYYSAKNFETANRSVLDVVRTATQKLSAAIVADTMIPRARITAFKLNSGQSLGEVALSDIDAKFSASRISRLLILDSNDAFIAVIHRSIWMEMLYLGAQSSPQITVANGKLGTLLSKTLDGQTFGRLAIEVIAFVAQNRSLADAKSAMEAKAGCQDVIVTANGAATEPVLGWITNVDITRASQP